ncbi:MAG: hypothetical protein GX624_01365 [Actinobacteria bacterium]|nr:hypothetical protein [Actinomycetota bacterium]
MTDGRADSRARRAPLPGGPQPARLAALVAAAAFAALALAGPAAAVYRPGDDWRHVESTLEAINRTPPKVPVVYLLGGSAARECITTEPAWRAQIKRFGGGRVRAFNLGSSSQAFKHSLRIVRAAPDVPTLVLIGLNVGRYTSIPPKSSALPAPSGGSRSARAAAVYDSHRFHKGQQLSDAAKRELVRKWLRVKYPRFKKRYAGNAAVLRKLIAACQERGFHPVLVELPLNVRIVRHSWDGARKRYRRGARAAAEAAGIPYVNFVGRIGLKSSDFVDLSHFVESGRAKYQRRLSRVVVTRLKQYGLAP